MSDGCLVKAAASPAAVMSCSECGSRSKRVDLLAVKSLVRHLPFGMPAAQYYYYDGRRFSTRKSARWGEIVWHDCFPVVSWHGLHSEK